MEDDRRETQRRTAPRKRTLKKGRIVFNNRRSVIDCTVRNLSDGGALLLVNSLIGIPDSFDLTIDSDSTTMRPMLCGSAKTSSA
jgi:hypothetical protein